MAAATLAKHLSEFVCMAYSKSMSEVRPHHTHIRMKKDRETEKDRQPDDRRQLQTVV